MKRTFIFVTAAALVTSLAGAALTYDGSAQLASLLEYQTPVIVENRLSIVPFQLLTLWMSRFIDNLFILRVTYSLMYCAVPLIALLLSWWIVRKNRPELMVWAGLGILAACLPGQIFFISEAIMTMQLFWPLLLLVILGIPRPKLHIPLIVLLSTFIFFAHPNAVVLFPILSIMAFIIGFKNRGNRKKLWSLVPFFLLGGFLRFQLIPVSLENEYALSTILEFIKVTLWGYPILFLALIYVTGFLLFFIPLQLNPWRNSNWPGYFILGLLVLSSIMIIVWAISPSKWVNALGMRRLVLFTNLPFVLLVFMEVVFIRNVPPDTENKLIRQNFRTRVISLLSIIFFLVLSIQSFGWIRISNRLMSELYSNQEACIPMNSIPWLSSTPLIHWATPSYALLLQSRTPDKLLLNEDDCSSVVIKKAIQISPYAIYPIDSGWFDFSKVSHYSSSQK